MFISWRLGTQWDWVANDSILTDTRALLTSEACQGTAARDNMLLVRRARTWAWPYLYHGHCMQTYP